MNQQNTVEIVEKPTTSFRMPVTVAEMLNMPVDPDFTVNEAAWWLNGDIENIEFSLKKTSAAMQGDNQCQQN